MPPLLQVEKLSVYYDSPSGSLAALRKVSFQIAVGEAVGIVGESGSGKSSLALALARLLPANGHFEADRLSLSGRNLLKMSEADFHCLRGDAIAIVLQEPAAAMDPLSRVGTQIVEGIRSRQGLRRKEARLLAVQLLTEIGIPEPERCADSYPHQLSGGMLQRALLAGALGANPKLLIADEPTTALDVSTQARILRQLTRLRASARMSILLISHDLSVVSAIADTVLILYLGSVVEQGPVARVLDNPQHPYTQALIRSLPGSGGFGPLPVIPGQVPSLRDIPSGCPFHPRCREAIEECRQGEIPQVEVSPGQTVRCLLRPIEAVT